MAIFTITSFSTFAGLLLAARGLGLAPDPVNRVKALADLATNGKALAAVLRDSGLTPLAAEMTRQAEEHSRHFTHPGAARDDALALFWQVAPEAFADPAAFAAAGLDPARTTEAMVAAIKASPQGRDFTATPLPEAFFRAVTRQTLGVMLGKADYIASITPDLWRETLHRHGVEIELLQAVRDDTTEILALVRELTETKATTVHQDTLIAIARKIRPNVPDREAALRELDRAADIAAELIARGHAGSNVDAFVDGVLRRLADLTDEGRLDEAKAEADAAVDRAEAGLAQLLDAAVNQHLLAFDAEGAALQIVRRLTLAATDPSALFDSLRREQDAWYKRGRDEGLRLDLEVAIALARLTYRQGRDSNHRGMALNDLGTALGTLGAREGISVRREASVTAFRAALDEWTRERVPLDWAATQMNLGNALQLLGERESGTARLEEAVTSYRSALKVWTRERMPLDWAATQMNLGVALRMLGVRGCDTARLEEAVAAHRAALEEIPRERMPFDWAGVKLNLGNALQALGELESGTTRLEEAVLAYRAALEELPRSRVPLDWAGGQMNLAVALAMLGERQRGTARLEEAVAAYRASLEVRTREHVPLDWASASGNQALAMLALADRTGDTASASTALAQLKQAAVEMRRGGHIPGAETFEHRIPLAEALVARLSGSPDKG